MNFTSTTGAVAVSDILLWRMEQHLHEDPSIKQAKIVDLAAPDAQERDLVVAISLQSDADRSGEDATRAARSILVSKMADAGGNSVVPTKWAQPAELPVAPTGEIDEIALQQSLLQQEASEEPLQPQNESLDTKIMRTISHAVHIPQDELVQTRSFNQNGGDSLTAIDVFQALLNENVSLRVPDIMCCESLAELPSLVISRASAASILPPPAFNAPPTTGTPLGEPDTGLRNDSVHELRVRQNSFVTEPIRLRENSVAEIRLREGSIAEAVRHNSIVEMAEEVADIVADAMTENPSMASRSASISYQPSRLRGNSLASVSGPAARFRAGSVAEAARHRNNSVSVPSAS